MHVDALDELVLELGHAEQELELLELYEPARQASGRVIRVCLMVFDGLPAFPL